ncbi:MAG TPA: hypothetical protein VG604_00900 [Candidatus Saccharimonadales bacterium]|nr:hypothetical protein [Candidatus Saccharimonadales bacterium]
MSESSSQKRSDKDRTIKRLRAVAEHPKTPRIVGKVASHLADVRTKTSDWSESKIGSVSPMAARLAIAGGKADAGLAKVEGKLDAQNDRIAQNRSWEPTPTPTPTVTVTPTPPLPSINHIQEPPAKTGGDSYEIC